MSECVCVCVRVCVCLPVSVCFRICMRAHIRSIMQVYMQQAEHRRQDMLLDRDFHAHVYGQAYYAM